MFIGNQLDQMAAVQHAMLEQQRYRNQQSGLLGAAQGMSSPNAPFYAANQAQQPQPNPVLLLLEDV